jgi:hypothetical protein
MITAQQLGPFLWRCAWHDVGVYHEAIGSTKWEAKRRVQALARRRAEGDARGCKGRNRK